MGYTLPVWCYASQVMVGITSAFLFEGRISRNKLYTALFFFKFVDEVRLNRLTQQHFKRIL